MKKISKEESEVSWRENCIVKKRNPATTKNQMGTHRHANSCYVPATQNRASEDKMIKPERHMKSTPED